MMAKELKSGIYFFFTLSRIFVLSSSRYYTSITGEIIIASKNVPVSTYQLGLYYQLLLYKYP